MNERRRASRHLARRITSVLAVTCAGLLAGASAQAQERGPLVLAKSSYFFIGGKVDSSVQGSPPVGQMYVEYMIPQRQTHRYPIIMVHGGAQSGTNFTGTPDGREGWAQFFVRRGYAVYVVDQVARGRSAYWSQVYGPVSQSRLDFTLQRFVAPERYNKWPQAHLHNQWPGAGNPDDPVFQQFYESQMPSLTSFAKQQEINPAALVALLDKIGPAIMVTHSQSGSFAWPVADQRPNLLKANVAVEPSGPPVHDLADNGPPDWFSDNDHVKPYGLGEAPITYDPPVSADSKLDFVRQDKADGPDLARCWAQKEPARKLPNVAKVPTVIISSEASYHAPYDHCTSAYLTQAGVKNTLIHLVDHGIHGNGHMMMLEKNNMAIARVMAEWIENNVQDEHVSRRERRRARRGR